MTSQKNQIATRLGYSAPDRVVVRGIDLSAQLLGNINLGDMAFLEWVGRLPDAGESRLFNAISITLVEHGITPSALAARLTYAGAPEALQSAVAAGLNGLGTVFVGSMEGAARMLAEALGTQAHSVDAVTVRHHAATVVDRQLRDGRSIPGIGHPVHKPVDPRAVRLLEIAAECGKAGPYVQLIQAVQQEAQERLGKVLPLNATGAIGAISCELGLPWIAVRGIGVIARAIGLVGHVMEEAERPIALEVWARADREAFSNAEHLP